MTANATNGKAAARKKPLLLITAFPGEGHTNPLLSIATYLVKKSYEVVFMTTPSFRNKVEQTGAEWVHADNPFTDEVFQHLRNAATLPIGPERFATQAKHVFMETQPARTQRTEEVLVMLQARDPSRQIIFLEDVFNWSFQPFRLGRPLPHGLHTMPKSIGIGVAALVIESQDTGPASLGLPYDPTDSGRQRNKILQALVEKGPLKPLIDAWQEAMRKNGCTTIPEGNVFRSCYTAYDFVLQLCSPSLEYPLSDIPSSIKFVGVLPRKEAGPDFQCPSWWSAVERNLENNYRHVIFVSQGTVNADYSELILPTINAFANREDVLVVAALGARGAQLSEGIVIPPNVRVVDYMPYDIILEYTDVFISNGGYGALTHAVRNGVPILLAGETEEKIEVTMRAVYAGLGVSLITQTPTPEEVRKGVERILQDNKYKKAAMRLKMENDNMDSLAGIEAKIRELTL